MMSAVGIAPTRPRHVLRVYPLMGVSQLRLTRSLFLKRKKIKDWIVGRSLRVCS